MNKKNIIIGAIELIVAIYIQQYSLQVLKNELWLLIPILILTAYHGGSGIMYIVKSFYDKSKKEN